MFLILSRKSLKLFLIDSYPLLLTYVFIVTYYNANLHLCLSDRKKKLKIIMRNKITNEKKNSNTMKNFRTYENIKSII